MMNTKTLSLKDNTLQPNFTGLTFRSFAISVKYFSNENPLPDKRIDYQSDIILTAKTDGYVIDINKHDFWFNRHQPDLINELITVDLSKTIYPVQAKIDKKGNFLGISNFNHIVNSRWHRNKLNSTSKYTTKIAQTFYNAFERNMENRTVFEKSMHHDWFWNLFFHPKYIHYGDQNAIETDLYLAVIPYENPIKFTGTQKINTDITNYHSVEIQFISSEMKAADYFIPKNISPLSGDHFYMSVKVYFDLDIYYLFPMHTRAYFEVYSKDSDGKKTSVKRIEFTQYQQGTENNKTKPARKKNSFLVEDEEEHYDSKKIYKTYDGKDYSYQEWMDFEAEQYKLYMEKKKKKGFWDFLGF